MEKAVERFIRYAREYTTSDPKSDTFPSTSRQTDFMKKLETELKEIGLHEIELDKYGYLMATIPANDAE
ncbi:MAG TPA: hypothetical protein VJ919_10935, partial [Tangfeifania sp.]|nr:hypothetical protein [Tangfeifania sp.]